MEKMNFKPGKQKILIKPKAVEKKTASGIIKPDSENPKSTQGTVVAIGKEIEEYVVGDNVLFGNNSGILIDVEGESYLLMTEREVYGIL